MGRQLCFKPSGSRGVKSGRWCQGECLAPEIRIRRIGIGDAHPLKKPWVLTRDVKPAGA